MKGQENGDSYSRHDATFGMQVIVDILWENWVTSILSGGDTSPGYERRYSPPALSGYAVGGLLESLAILADVANEERRRMIKADAGETCPPKPRAEGRS